jgi:hypothetical protein
VIGDFGRRMFPSSFQSSLKIASSERRVFVLVIGSLGKLKSGREVAR